VVRQLSRNDQVFSVYTAACNSFFQSLAADSAKRALFEVLKHCQAKPESALYSSHVVNFLHDEIMVQEFNHFTPDVLVKASPQLMRCWSKNGKAIYNAQGRLVPWQQTTSIYVSTRIRGHLCLGHERFTVGQFESWKMLFT
jgi:hypothetical protein